MARAELDDTDTFSPRQKKGTMDLGYEFSNYLFDPDQSVMDLDGIRDALRKVPFEPFAFRLADGRSLPVRHPEFVAVGRRRIVVVADDDSWSVVEPLLIVSLDSLPPSPSQGDGDGQTRP
jgi:hypothetical protein